MPERPGALSSSVRFTRPRQRTRTGPARVISCGKVKIISTGDQLVTCLGRKKYTPSELTSRDSVCASPTAAPLVQPTDMGHWIPTRRAVRRSILDYVILRNDTV